MAIEMTAYGDMTEQERDDIAECILKLIYREDNRVYALVVLDDGGGMVVIGDKCLSNKDLADLFRSAEINLTGVA